MSDDNPSERSDLLSGDDASAPVLPRMVDEPAKPVPVVLVAKQSRKWDDIEGRLREIPALRTGFCEFSRAFSQLAC